MENISASSSTMTRREYGNIQVSGSGLTVIGDLIGDLSQSILGQQIVESSARAAILQSLKFDGMNVRRASILGTERKFFAWIWSTTFSSWLQSRENAFWITGKPGSGKSTLVRHLADSRLTQERLEARGTPWLVLHFFFDFRFKKGIANSPEGMLRTLLIQISMHIDQTASVLADLKDTGQLEHGSVQELLDACCWAIRKAHRHFCIFIDGLDEYEGPLLELISILFQLTEREHNTVKVCFASRPVPAAMSQLQRCSSLTMQDHNLPTIRAYLESLNHDREIQRLNTIPRSVLERIVLKADGVILWARFAFEQLAESIPLSDTEDDLLIRVRNLPDSIVGIYQDHFSRLAPVSETEAALYLLFIDTAPDRLITVPELEALIRAAKKRFPHHVLVPDEILVNHFETRLFSIVQTFVQTFQTDVIDLVAGFVTCHAQDFHPPTTLVVRPIHETLRAYLKKSSWYNKCLSSLHHGNNFEDLVLSLYAEARSTSIQYSYRRLEGEVYRDLEGGFLTTPGSTETLHFRLLEHTILATFHQNERSIREWLSTSYLTTQPNKTVAVLANIASLLVYKGFHGRVNRLIDSYR